ncbi:hypothetical protein GGR57DRAFT_244606 [Xylariaceae sp. FL1272]|nr:hypothetical protein GGR57DRAFT_244606 [Xylariaceae sp. FL1272]
MSVPAMRMLTLASLSLLSCFACMSMYIHDADIEHVHQTLSLLMSRGQLSLELLPPLSFLISGLFPMLWLSLISMTAQSLTLLLQLHRIRSIGKSPAMSMCVFLAGFMIVYASCYPTPLHWTVLQSCSSVSNLLLTFIIFRFSKCTPRTDFAQRARVDEMLMAISWALGCNLGDMVVIFCVVLLHRTKQVVVQSKSYRTDSAVLAEICLTIFSSILALVITLGLLYGLLFPMSEVQTGGNYNLHFLSPEARRMLSPIERSLAAPSWSNHTIPPHAVIPYLPASLYIPMAGFLWLDDAVWLDDLGVWSRASLEREDSLSHPRRVFFSDPISTRHPWAFELAMNPDASLDTRQQDYIHSHLWPGEGIFLRSRITGHFVGISPGQTSLIDREMHIGPGSDGFSRTLVSGQEERSENTTWVIEYDPQADTGFRLLNPAHGCYLASSFRTYPDWDGERSLDVVASQMNMVIETVCTRLASTKASTFYIIEGPHMEQSGPIPYALKPLHRFKTLMTWGFHVATGLNALSSFRKTHGHRIDVPVALRSMNAEPNGFESNVESFVFYLFLVVHLWWSLSRQRTGLAGVRGGRTARQPGAKATISRVHVSAALVYTHYICYTLVGFPRAYGCRFVMLQALIGTATMLLN